MHALHPRIERAGLVVHKSRTGTLHLAHVLPRTVVVCRLIIDSGLRYCRPIQSLYGACLACHGSLRIVRTITYRYEPRRPLRSCDRERALPSFCP